MTLLKQFQRLNKYKNTIFCGFHSSLYFSNLGESKTHVHTVCITTVYNIYAVDAGTRKTFLALVSHSLITHRFRNTRRDPYPFCNNNKQFK